MIAINKHSSKPKDWSVKMPNAPYSNRYVKCLEKNYVAKINKRNRL